MYIDRSEIKQEAKKRLRGHIGEGFIIGILPILLVAVSMVIVTIAWQGGSQVDTGVSSTVSSFNLGNGTTVEAIITSVVSGILQVSTSLGFLTWLRQRPANQSPLTRGLTAFQPNYFFGILAIFALSTILYNVPSMVQALNTKDDYFLSVVYIVLLIVMIVIQLGLSQVYYVYLDLKDARTGGIIDAFRYSWQLMSGFKGQYFILELSFIGWDLLGLLVIPLIWVMPYQRITYAAFYEKVKDHKQILPTAAK